MRCPFRHGLCRATSPRGGGKTWRPQGGSCRRSRLRGVPMCIAILLSLTACGPKAEPHSSTIFAMDTVMNLTIYGEGKVASGQDMLSLMAAWINEIEGELSVTKEGSDIHNINANGGNPTQVSDNTARLLKQALDLCEQTGGTLDITAYPAIKAWGFTTGEYRVVDETERVELAEHIDYRCVELDGTSVTLPEGMEMDLGAVAKGYTGDVLVLGLEEAGIASALLDLGQSTISAIGTKPDGKPWRIGIQDPYGEGYLGVLELNDRSMGSSGNYQRYFEENGQIYGHILDPETAAPADSGLAGVTVVADSALLCDGLGTALFVMGLEEAGDYWAENRHFDAIFIEENGDITVTAGLKDSFTLAEGYLDREVTILE